LSEVLGVEAIVEGIPTVQPARSGPPVAASALPALAKPDPFEPASDRPVTSSGAPSDPPAPARPDVPPERGSTPMQRARAAVAKEERTREASVSSPGADDSMVSADDEDIVEAVAVGQPVIARVLGGTVIGELDQ
jgi:DNA polymerase-3 subunit gamma/tau